jgi:hypothetical protein
MFPGLFQHRRRKNRTVADAICNKSWIRDVMHNIFPSLLAEYVTLWTLIDAAEVDTEDVSEDEIIWTRMATGEYSARSAYEIQFDGSLNSSFPAMLWRVWAPSRCKVLLAYASEQNMDRRSAAAQRMAE